MADDREFWKKIANGNANAFDAWYRTNVTQANPQRKAELKDLLARADLDAMEVD